MYDISQELAKAYSSGELCGWGEIHCPGLAKEAFDLLVEEGEVYESLNIVGQSHPTAGRKTMLYQFCRTALGKDTPNYPQRDGDCVSFGAKNAVEYLSCIQAVKAGRKLKFRPVFPPYFYGTGRVYVGRGRLGNQPGSIGSWMSAAAKKYGTLYSDEQGVPPYSKQIARMWGDPDPRPDLDKWKSLASNFPVGSTALVSTWAELVAAITNGYPVTTASNIGYSMGPGRDGFHVQNTNWGHQMCVIGVDDGYKNGEEPYAIILNSWGEDAHGRLKDFDDGHLLPGGVLRVRRKDMEKHLRERESFAYSQFKDGFREQDLSRELFDLVGA